MCSILNNSKMALVHIRNCRLNKSPGLFVSKRDKETDRWKDWEAAKLTEILTYSVHTVYRKSVAPVFFTI